MGNADKRSSTKRLNRRTFIAGISAASTTGLAGCQGGNNSDDGGNNSDDGGNNSGDGRNLGRRVPTITISYWSNVGNMTNVFESALPIIQKNYQKLGLDVELRPVEYTTNVSELINPPRKSNMNSIYYNSEPTRLDPDAMLTKFLIPYAGDTGTLNLGNWADCKMTRLVKEQQTQTSKKKREQTVLKAQQRLCKEAILQPFAPYNNPSAAWKNRIEVKSVGKAGMSEQNTEFLIRSTPKKGDALTVNTNPTIMVNKNYHTMTGAEETPWNTLVNSPLQGYNKDLELINVLAEDISTENDGKRAVVKIKQNANFQNGDPVTAEDVDFTFMHVWKNQGKFGSNPPPLKSTDVIDNKTWALNLKTPYAPLSVNFAKQGIVHKESWIEYGARESPGNMNIGEVIGSGPYKLVDFQREQYMRMTPTDNHPMYQAESDLIMRAYRDLSTATQAFRSKEIDVILGITFDILKNFNESYGSKVRTGAAEGPLPITLINEVSYGPMMFREFRRALGKSINRQTINEVAFNGELYMPLSGNIFMRNHPWAADRDEVYQYTDDPTGDIKGARALLSGAGWGWDDNGRLHYPKGADLSPMWPKGEAPDPANYECLDKDGNLSL